MALSEGDDDHDDEPALMLLADCSKIFEDLEAKGRPIWPRASMRRSPAPSW